ncbi:MAG: hypothetical protein ACFCD0_16805 [Gemmataceae bacterium]
MQFVVVIVVIAVFVVFGTMFGLFLLRSRGMHRCFVSYLKQSSRRRIPSSDEPVHVLICFADHYEPKYRNPLPEIALQRVRTWVDRYPKQFREFRDSDDKPPRYTFFYPSEEYDPEYLDLLRGLCQEGFGEVEIHLHHDQDTPDSFRTNLLRFKAALVERHGLLSHDRVTGEVMYGFIHGNWVLCNWHKNGLNCGVNEEITILRETGCYADLTMPTAPGIPQGPIINSIYYARDIPGQARSHEKGVLANGHAPEDGLLMIQGPLVLDWKTRKFGVLPKLENGCVQTSQVADVSRLPSWLKAGVQVPTRPDWFFVKLHMHGAPEDSHEALLGEPMVRFHQDLAALAKANSNFHFHYVTAREMYNLVKAAEAGWTGSVEDARDYQLVWNGGLPRVES